MNITEHKEYPIPQNTIIHRIIIFCDNCEFSKRSYRYGGCEVGIDELGEKVYSRPILRNLNGRITGDWYFTNESMLNKIKHFKKGRYQEREIFIAFCTDEQFHEVWHKITEKAKNYALDKLKKFEESMEDKINEFKSKLLQEHNELVIIADKMTRLP
jgi:hypothetical protein